MTPKDKIKLKNEAQTRTMEMLVCRAGTDEDTGSYLVEGYAARFEPYKYFTLEDGTDVYELFTKENIDGADKSDVIMQYDHEGRVFARTSNGSLIVNTDDVGMHITADLGRTEGARALYEDIKAGMITKMSWRFSFFPGDMKYDVDSHTITYDRICRIYDVSAVSIPANDSTSISARAFVDGEIAKEKARIDAARRLDESRREIQDILGGI